MGSACVFGNCDLGDQIELKQTSSLGYGLDQELTRTGSLVLSGSVVVFVS